MIDRIGLQGIGVSDEKPSPETAGDKALGKDAFLKLLVAQISQQDPLKPVSDTQFVAQLAQFTSLEQQMSTNKLLELVAVQQKGLANSANADLVGKTVTVRGGTLSLDGQGLGAPMRFTLDGPASKVTVTVRDTSGRVVRTLDLGARPQGAVNTLWDGKDDAGNPQPAGAYTISVQAKNADGSTVPVTQETTGRVTSVSYEQGYATLVLDNGTSAPTSELLRIQSDAKPSGTK